MQKDICFIFIRIVVITWLTTVFSSSCSQLAQIFYQIENKCVRLRVDFIFFLRDRALFYLYADFLHMTQKYQLLHDLLTQLEAYEDASQHQDMSLMGFSGWLNRQLVYPTPTHVAPPDEDALEEAKDSQSETALTILIGYLYRYTKHYTKKALDDTLLSTFDDFAFLATLSYQDSMTKTELIQQHILEITSGIEIIKRLTKNGLLEAFADPNDRRSKRVRLTEAGKEVLTEVMVKMDDVAHIVSGDLKIEDRALLLSLLHKLNDFHALIHMTDRKSDLTSIQEKYLPSTEKKKEKLEVEYN